MEGTGEVFERSPIKAQQENQGEKWNYAACFTTIQKGKGIMAGLNPKGNKKTYPDYPMDAGKLNGSFAKQGFKFINKYLNIETIGDLNYSNSCFFSSPYVADLTSKDWTLALPLFMQYVEYIDPPWIVLFGSTGRRKLKNRDYLSNILKETSELDENNAYAYHDLLNKKYHLFSFPHTQAKFSAEAKNELWEKMSERIL